MWLNEKLIALSSLKKPSPRWPRLKASKAGAQRAMWVLAIRVTLGSAVASFAYEKRTLSGHRQSVVRDAVDGAHSTASMCQRWLR